MELIKIVCGEPVDGVMVKVAVSHLTDCVVQDLDLVA